MYRYITFLAAALFSIATLQAQQVNGKLKSKGDADLHVIRLFADSFPSVALTFQAQAPNGDPVWNLDKSDVRVEENGQTGRITNFQLLSADKHLQTELVIDHSGSMNTDWRYQQWLNTINWDTIPYDTIRVEWTCNCACTGGSAEVPATCPCGYTRHDTLTVYKRTPVNLDYKSPLWYAQQGAKTFLASMNLKQDTTSIIGFSDRPEENIQNARPDERTEASIDRFFANGGTALYDAVGEALNNLVYHRGLRSVVVLTDGKDNESKLSLDAVIAKAKKMHTPVYAIGLGDVDPKALQRLTEETGGELFLTHDATQLAEVYLKISKKLQSVYELVYQSPFLSSPDSTHELQLRFDVDSMYLYSQIVDLPLPADVITHLQEREVKQQAIADAFPIVNDPKENGGEVSPAESALKDVPVDTPSEFPYGELGITLLVGGAGTLIYRKTKSKKKNSSVTIATIYPNPTSGISTMDYAAIGVMDMLQYSVTDQNGREVKNGMLASDSSSATIDFSGMDAGLYLVVIRSSANVSNVMKVLVTAP